MKTEVRQKHHVHDTNMIFKLIMFRSVAARTEMLDALFTFVAKRITTFENEIAKCSIYTCA